MIFGTPEYMSPEQAQGSTPDHRVDVYAVGCIMYHMLTGSVPFKADNFMGILTKHLLEAPVPPRKRRPDLDIPPDVEAICLKAMEKDRDKRLPDMDAFYRALGAAGGLPFEPSQVFVAPRPPKASLKYPTLAAANLEARESRTAIARSAERSRTSGRSGREAVGGAAASRSIIAAVAGPRWRASAVLASSCGLRRRARSPPGRRPPAMARRAAVAPAVPPPRQPPRPPSRRSRRRRSAGRDDEVLVEATAAPTAEQQSDAPRPRRRHPDSSNEAEGRSAYTGRSPVPAETQPTPAELKNPFRPER